MKKRMVAAAAVMVLVAAAAWAQQGPANDRGMRGRGQNRFDPSRIETIQGEVQEIREFTSRNPEHKGIGLIMTTGDRTITVHLGPQFFLDKQQVKIAAGDSIEVSGVRTARRGEELFLAGEVKKNGEVLKLRDETGRPLWAGTGPRAGKLYRKPPIGC